MEVVGATWLEKEEGSYVSQKKFITRKLQEVPVTQLSKIEKTQVFPETSEVYKFFRRQLGNLIWVLLTRPECGREASFAAAECKHLKIEAIRAFNACIAFLKDTADRAFFIPRLAREQPYRLCAVLDASFGSRPDGSSQGAHAIGISVPSAHIFGVIHCRSARLRRTNSSSFDSECVETVACLDWVTVIHMALQELEFGILPTLSQRHILSLSGVRVTPKRIPIDMHGDALDVIDRALSTKRSLDLAKRRLLDVSDIQECITFGELQSFSHIRGCSNPLDPGTKVLTRHCQQFVRLLRMLHDAQYIPDFTNNEEKFRSIHFCRQCQSLMCSAVRT